MKLTPASNAASTIRCASAASVRSPNVIVPRQIGGDVEPAVAEATVFHAHADSLQAVRPAAGRCAQALHVRHRQRAPQHGLAEPFGGATRAFGDGLRRHLQVVVVVDVEAVVAAVADRVELA